MALRYSLPKLNWRYLWGGLTNGWYHHRLNGFFCRLQWTQGVRLCSVGRVTLWWFFNFSRKCVRVAQESPASISSGCVESSHAIVSMRFLPVAPLLFPRLSVPLWGSAEIVRLLTCSSRNCLWSWSMWRIDYCLCGAGCRRFVFVAVVVLGRFCIGRITTRCGANDWTRRICCFDLMRSSPNTLLRDC